MMMATGHGWVRPGLIGRFPQRTRRRSQISIAVCPSLPLHKESCSRISIALPVFLSLYLLIVRTADQKEIVAFIHLLI
jgi:hypothetical protein